MKSVKKILAIAAATTMVLVSIFATSFADSTEPSWMGDQGTVTPTNTDLTFRVQWNDNNNENSKEARPTEEDFSKGATLYFTLDGEKYELNETTMKYLGMEEMPSISFAATGSEYSLWSFKTSLPTKITTVDPPTEQPKEDGSTDGSGEGSGEQQGGGSTDGSTDGSGEGSGEQPGGGSTDGSTDGSGEESGEQPGGGSTDGSTDGSGDGSGTETVTPDPVDHDITWTMEYTYDDNDYIKGDETVSGNTYTTKFTLTSDYSGTIIWEDNGNRYNSRPDFDSMNYKVYRYTLGESRSTAVEIPDAKVIAGDPDEDSQVTLSLDKEPAYDKDGNPYIYYIDFGVDDIEAESDAGSYGVLYDNVDNYTNIERAVYPGGSVTLTLQDTQDVSMYKIWKDDNSENRPDLTLYLYRVAENSDGTITQESIDKASPVEGYDSESVPTTNQQGEVIPDGNSTKITFGDGKELPKYNSTGHRYVYFAMEYGSRSGYKTTYDNTDTEYTETEKKLATSNNRVLDGGSITNELHGVLNTKATKSFEAKALQTASVSVRYTLQIKENGQWRYATKDDFADNYNMSSNKNLSEDKDGHIVLQFDGFSAEINTMTLDGPSLKQYTEGKENSYRWEETGYRIGNTWWDVAAEDPAADTLTYPEYNLGDVAPGVGDLRTTLRGQVTQNSDTEITNSIVGETQVKITKTWTDNGKNVAAEEETKDLTATFNIYRDGSDEVVKTVTLTQEDLNDSSTAWEKITENLPRFDEHGREYAYSVSEESVAGWHTEYSSSTSVVKDTSEKNEGKNFLVTQKNYEFNNSKGPGESLHVDVEKKWMDESDLDSRKPVTVSVYRLSDDKTTATKVEGTTTTLWTSNSWNKRITFNRVEEGDTIDNYIIKEDDINEFEVSYEDIQSIYSNQDKKQTYSDDQIVGTAEEAGDYDKIQYYYDVFIHRNDHSDGAASYTISNRRKGVLNLHFKKTWNAGGSTPVAGFAVYRSTEDDPEETKVLEFEMPGEGTQGSVTIKKNATDNTYTADIKDLPKYDKYGNQYNYSVVETWMGDKSNLFQDAGDGIKTVELDGDDYISSTFQEHVDIAGVTKHCSGDTYYWEGTNTRTGSYHLNSYKVWRDDGKKNQKKRPDVYFTLYRIVITDNEVLGLDTSLQDLCEQRLNEGLAEVVKTDKIWNTKLNDWCWSCDLGNVARYDSAGDRYIYFIKEGFNGSSGDYVDYYNNGFTTPNTGAASSTKDVMDISLDDPSISRNVTILSDGYNQGKNGCGDYYSRTVINVREKTRTASGQKVWKLPSGYQIPDSELPTVEVSLYRTVDEIPEDVLNDYEAMTKAVNDGEYDLEYMNKHTISYGNNAFKFTKDSDGNELQKYDGYGRTYNYYMYESVKSDVYDYSITASSESSFTITNTYNYGDKHVKININKSWKSTLDSSKVDDMVTAKFDLYMVICDSSGKQVSGTSPIKVATGVLGSDETELTFDKITVGDNVGTELPYLGPNGEKVKYYVKETAVNGVTVTADTGTSLDKAIELTANDEGTLYTGSVDFENDYTGGKKNISFQKIWSDQTNATGQDNSVYRPDKVTLNIYRKWSKTNVNGKAYPGGDEFYKSVEVTGGKDPNTVHNWKYEEKDVAKYAPNGQEFTYYVQSETIAEPNNSYYIGAANGSNYENTLKQRNYIIKKTWTNDETGKALTAAEIKNLVSLGVLPEKVTFTLLQKDSAGNEIAIGTKEYTSSDYTNTNWSYQWYGLPQTDTKGNAYTYRVKETIGDLVVYSDQTEETTGKIDKNSNFSGETATVTWTDGNKITFNNAIDMHKLKVVKAWEDNSNCDNTRPDSIKVTIAGQEYTLKKSGNGDSWTLDGIYVPAVDSDKYEETIETAETEIPGYKLVSTKWESDADSDSGSVTFTNEATVERVKIDISGEKAFKGDADWTTVRPVLKLALQYQKQGSDEWVTVTEANKDQIGLTGSPVQTVAIGSDGTGKVEWPGLYKYWTKPTTPGTPEAISYRIVEKCYASETSTKELDKTAYKVTSTEADATVVGKVESSIKDGKAQTFSGTARIENTLITTNVEATKKWVDYDNEEGLRTPITMSLRANGTVVATKICNDDNDWHVNFQDLPKMDLQGEEITYTVTESVPAGYDNVVSGDAESGFIFTNTLNKGTIVFTKSGLVNETCSTNELYPADGTELLDGAEFGLYKTDGTEVATAKSSNGEVKFTEVRNGKYYVQEISAPSPYTVEDTKYYVDIVKGLSSGLYTEEGNTDSVLEDQTIIDDQPRTSITLNKVNGDDGTTPLPDATYGLYRVEKDTDTNTDKYIQITTGKTDKDGKLTFEGLITGKEYEIKELNPPAGSYTSKDPVKFTVETDGKDAIISNFDGGKGTATMGEDGTITWNEPMVKALITKVDQDGDILAGAKLEVIDPETGDVIDKWKSTNEGHEIIDILEAGKTYTLHEVKAPKGYELAEDVEFTIPDKSYESDSAPIIKVKMVDKMIEEDITPSDGEDDSDSGIDTGDHSNMPMTFIGMMASMAALLGLSGIRRRRSL